VVREAEPLGLDEALWKKTLQLGAVAMGVPIEVGGDGAGLLELSLIAEELGRNLAPVPLIEAVVATRLLSRFSDQLGSRWAEVREGQRLATLAFRPFVNGTSRLVPAGAAADMVVGLDGDALVLVDVRNVEQREVFENLGSSPLADITIGGSSEVLLRGPEALDALNRAVDEWKVLIAAALIGIAQKAHDIGLEYVKNRRVFGTVVGTFQSVAHRLADDIVQIDGCRLLIREAAWSADEGTEFASSLISGAFAYAAETATIVTGHALHFHGGSGYIMEQDIQLFFRRAKAWPLVYGDPRHEYQLVADKTWGPREVR
jgi:alkylation response protein AidB-like acyl-CoA dehydrogenase